MAGGSIVVLGRALATNPLTADAGLASGAANAFPVVLDIAGARTVDFAMFASVAFMLPPAASFLNSSRRHAYMTSEFMH